MSIGVPIAFFPITFIAQLKLGYEVSLFPLYMLPIAALSWGFGLSGALLSILLSTGLWYWGNVLSGYTYTYEWTRYYNTGARAVVFAMVAVFIMLFKRVVEQHRRRMEAMRALLNVCHGCGSIQGSDGKWIPFDQLTVSKVRPPCECPECARLAQNITARKGQGLQKPAEGVAEEVDEKALGRPWQPGDDDRRRHIRREEDR